MTALKAEGPPDTHELTSRVMTAKGLIGDDRVLAQAISLRIVQTLRMKARRSGMLYGSEGRKGACVWRPAIVASDNGFNSGLPRKPAGQI